VGFPLPVAVPCLTWLEGIKFMGDGRASCARLVPQVDAAGTSNSANVRLTRQKSALFQWLAVSLWFPTDKDSVPTDSGAFRSSAFSTRRPASSPALGGSIHKLTAPSTGSERLTRFSIVCSASRCRHSARDALGRGPRGVCDGSGCLDSFRGE